MRILLALCFVGSIPATLSAETFPTNVADKISVDSLDWPWWRGPQRNGTAYTGQQPPLKWSATENVLWKTRVPGRGHGSPTVVGNHVYLATADRARDLQSVLCFDRSTGEQLWETVIHRGGLMKKNKKASQASSTVAWDGERLFVNFLNDGAVFTTAISPHGQELWQTKISDYVIHQGFSTSPAVYQNLVLVTADNKGGGAIAALSRQTGDVAWRRDRPRIPNYPSPIVLNVAGRDQVIMTGCKLVSSFDPLTGNILWEIDGATEECVTSTVTDGKHVYSSGGYPDNHVAAIKADGSGEVVWRNNTRLYVPSLLIKVGFLYGVLDAGVAICWNAETGQERWKSRLGGPYSSSPVLVGDHIYATNETGTTYIFKANPAKFELVAENQLGDDVLATPAICGGRIYTRIAMLDDGNRQEYLYCLSEE